MNAPTDVNADARDARERATTANPQLLPGTGYEGCDTDPHRLDRHVLDALSARSRSSLDTAAEDLADLAGQCLRAIHRVSAQHDAVRTTAEQTGYGPDDAEYAETVALLSGFGASLADMRDRLYQAESAESLEHHDAVAAAADAAGTATAEPGSRGEAAS